MSGLTHGRLIEERKSWRKDHPLGFVAKPHNTDDGTLNLMEWDCIIPGKSGTDWEGGYYPLTIHFSDDYPYRAPSCKFPRAFFHPNVYLSGLVCHSILSSRGGWRPSFTVKQILLAIQDLLDKPNPQSPAQNEALDIFCKDPHDYKQKVKQQAKKYARKE